MNGVKRRGYQVKLYKIGAIALVIVTISSAGCVSNYSVNLKFEDSKFNGTFLPSVKEGLGVNISITTDPPVEKEAELYMIINDSREVVSKGMLVNGKYTFNVTIPDPGKNRVIAFQAEAGGVQSNTISVDVIERLNLSGLSDEDIITYALKNDTFVKWYDGWEFRINEKQLVKKDGEGAVYVDAWAGKDNWSVANHVWFYLNEWGELKDLRIYPYVKTTVPFSLSEKERNKLIKIALNNATVRELLEEKQWNAVIAHEFRNIFTNESYGQQIYFHINNTSIVYIVSFDDDKVSYIRKSMWLDRG